MKRRYYLLTFIILLSIEIVIALFINDRFIRPYVGDVLIIILMYTFVRGIKQKLIRFLPIYLLLFAVSVEVVQYFDLIQMLNIKDNILLATIIGSTFDIKDIVCYLVGTIVIVIWEKVENNTKREVFINV